MLAGLQIKETTYWIFSTTNIKIGLEVVPQILFSPTFVVVIIFLPILYQAGKELTERSE